MWLVGVVNVCLAFVVLSLLQTFVVRIHRVSSASMEQTLGVGDRVLASPLPYLFRDPARGDVIAFAHGQTWADRSLPASPDPVTTALRFVGDHVGIGPRSYAFTVKRVIGVGGDEVGCCDSGGRIIVNGSAVDEPYVYEDIRFRPGEYDCSTVPRSPRCFSAIRVPAGELLLLGDHRSNSADSLTNCRSAASRADCAEFVDADQVTGEVLARGWPPGPVR